MEAEDVWTVEETHRFDVVTEFDNRFAAWDLVVRCKFELIGEHVVQEPDTRVGVQQAFVEIVCDTTTVVN